MPLDAPPADAAVTLAPERPGDHARVEALFDAAFGPGRHAKTSYRVREMTEPAPELSRLAWSGERLVGAARQHRVRAGDVRGTFLGPFGVAADARSRGLGAELIRAAARAAEEAGLDFVLLIGGADYFLPLGFETVEVGSLRLPGVIDPARLLVRRLSDLPAPRGVLTADG